MSVAIALFTRDLQVHDNPVLHAACQPPARGPAVYQPSKLDPSQRADLDYPDPIIDLRDGADHFRTARDKTGGEQ